MGITDFMKKQTNDGEQPTQSKHRLTQGVEAGIQSIKSLAKTAIKTVRWLVQLAIQLIISLLSPQTWIILLLFLLAMYFYSISNVIGKNDFPEHLGKTQPPNIDSLEEDFRGQALATWLASTSDLSKEVSSYIAILYEESGGNLDKINVTLAGDCQSDCIIDKIEKNELSDLEITPWGLRGENARKLLEVAKASNRLWQNSSVQLETMKSILTTRAREGSSKLTKEKIPKEAIQEVNSILGIIDTEQTLNEKVKKVEEYTKKITPLVASAEPLGTGNKRGRAANSGGGKSNKNIKADGKAIKADPNAKFSLPTTMTTISSGYGYRNLSIGGSDLSFHNGVDFPVPANTPVYAAADGVVEIATYDGGGGNYIRITHDNGYTTYYGHLSSFNTSVGSTVKEGEVIAYSGNTGLYTTGAHLHFGVYIGTSWDTVDPTPMLGL